jgi:hypothetical protein
LAGFCELKGGSGRYKSQLVEGSGTGYLGRACDYVHPNPVRARMLKARERLLSYPWSSFGAYLAAPAHRPGWIRVDRLLGEHGIQGDKARDDADDQSDCGAGEPGELEGGQRQAASPHAGRSEPPQSQTAPRWQEDMSANE